MLNDLINTFKTSVAKRSILSAMRDLSPVLDAIDGVSSGFVSLKSFGITGDGTTEVADAIQAAINWAVTNGKSGLFVPPGTYLVSRLKTIVVPTNFTIQGVHGRSIFQATGNTFTPAGSVTFPDARGFSMFVTGVPSTGARYGTQTGRITTGTGATLNFTITGGAVTAATVASGGTGYKVGDAIAFANNTVITVRTVSSGAIVSVVIKSGGSGWGAASNPYSQTSANGQTSRDRVFDINSFADEVHFRDIVIDGAWGDYGTFAQLTSGQSYMGIRAVAVLNFSFKGVIAKNFPNTGLFASDFRRGVVTDCRAENCGWTGVFGSSRNGFSHAPMYCLSQPQLNCQELIFMRNIAYKIGDVGAQFSTVQNFQIRDNSFLGCGTIAIEGESSGYNVYDTFATNGGVKVPGDGVISNNFINGLMQDGTLATDSFSSFTAVSTYALNGISWAAGNEGRIDIHNNVIRNISSSGIKAQQNSGGVFSIEGNDLFNVQQAGSGIGASTSALAQAIYASCQDLRIVRNRVLSVYRGEMIRFETNFNSPTTNYIDITDNELGSPTTYVGSNTITVQMSRSSAPQRIDISRNKGMLTDGEFIRVECIGANTTGVNVVKINDNVMVNGNRYGATTQSSYINVLTRSSGTLNINHIEMTGNSIYESSVRTTSTTPLISYNPTTTFSPSYVNVTNLKAPQFTTELGFTPYLIAPTIFGTSTVVKIDAPTAPIYKTAAYTLTRFDDGTYFVYNVVTTTGVFTLPNNLPVGFKIKVFQKNTGQVSFVAASGATLVNRQSFTKTAGQNAEVSLTVIDNGSGTAAIYALSGDGAV